LISLTFIKNFFKCLLKDYFWFVYGCGTVILPPKKVGVRPGLGGVVGCVAAELVGMPPELGGVVGRPHRQAPAALFRRGKWTRARRGTEI